MQCQKPQDEDFKSYKTLSSVLLLHFNASLLWVFGEIEGVRSSFYIQLNFCTTMPKTNKSVIVENNSIHVASPLTMADIVNFAKLIADIIYQSPYYNREAHIFEVEFDDYTAEVEYLIEYERDEVTRSQGIVLYDFIKVGESIEVLDVKHWNGTSHPVMCYALNRILQ